MTDLSGHDVGRYHIIEPLGQGGMATVYRAYDDRLDREVAIKFIRREAVPPDHAAAMLKRFEREAKSLAKLSHPNIVKVHDFGEHDGSPYLVMEYLHGGTLKVRMGQAMAPADAIRWLLPIARALDYAHRNNVIHRDVKPANILLNGDGEPMLTDFGIAKILETDEATLTGTGVGIGTPEYMSPEQCVGKNVDRRTDIYALGVVFYELVTGRKPFRADTPMAVVIMHVNSPLPRPKVYVPDLPDEVEAVLFKALAKNPDERYQDMSAFAAAMENILKNIERIPQANEHLAATMTTSLYEQRVENAFAPRTVGSEEATISPPLEKETVEYVPASIHFNIEPGVTVSPPVKIEKTEETSNYRWLIPVLAVGGSVGVVLLILAVVLLVSGLPAKILGLGASPTPGLMMTQLPSENQGDLPEGQSTPAGQPETPLQTQGAANPTETNIPLAVSTEGVSPKTVGKLITVKQLPKLVLATNEIPSGWTSEKRNSLTNEDWITYASNPDEIRKILEDSGRISEAIDYKYTAPGDPCQIMDGPIEVNVSVDLFAQPEGARLFYEWDSYSGKNMGIGEQSEYTYLQQTINYPSCNTTFITYDLRFQRLNTLVSVGMEALTGAMSDSEVEKQIIAYAKIVDGKIITNAK